MASQFITCGNQMFNMAFIKKLQMHDGQVQLTVANTNHTYKSNGIYGNYVKDWDKVWTCPKDQFTGTYSSFTEQGLMSIAKLQAPTSVESPEVSEMSTVDPPKNK